MISPDEALETIVSFVRPLKATRKALWESLGRCLAEDVRADRDQPPADRSAMDGYAVRARDLKECPCELRLVGEVAAGSEAAPTVRQGTCAGVLTGANVPPGADAVVIVEQTSESDGLVRFDCPTAVGANIRRRGEEARKGQLLLEKGTLLGPAEIGICASVGAAAVKVHPRARVAVLCTGQELREPGEPVAPHELRNSNGPALCAALKMFGYRDAGYQTVPDDPKVLAEKLADAAAGHDVIILTGGVSVGKYDFVPEAVKRIGAVIRFRGVAMKPGKPLLYATLSRNRHVFGLPGNPISALSSFHGFVLPALRRISGLAVERCRRSVEMRLGGPLRSKKGRVRFVLARLVWGKDGPVAEPLKSRGSADLVSACRADGVVVVPADTENLCAGESVEFLPWRAVP